MADLAAAGLALVCWYGLMLKMKKPPLIQGGFFMVIAVSVTLLGCWGLQDRRHAHFT